MVTFGYRPDNVKPAADMADTPVDQVYIGSCTNGRISDLRIAARVLTGKRISGKVRAIVSPATPEVYRQALAEGLIKIFMDAGFCVTNPTCGACLGMSNGVLADGESLRRHHQPELQRPHGQGGHGPPDEPCHRRGHRHCRHDCQQFVVRGVGLEKHQAPRVWDSRIQVKRQHWAPRPLESLPPF
jgi:hypothetical protein